MSLPTVIPTNTDKFVELVLDSSLYTLSDSVVSKHGVGLSVKHGLVYLVSDAIYLWGTQYYLLTGLGGLSTEQYISPNHVTDAVIKTIHNTILTSIAKRITDIGPSYMAILINAGLSSAVSEFLQYVLQGRIYSATY